MKRECKVLLVVELVEVGDVISVRKSLWTDEGIVILAYVSCINYDRACECSPGPGCSKDG